MLLTRFLVTPPRHAIAQPACQSWLARAHAIAAGDAMLGERIARVLAKVACQIETRGHSVDEIAAGRWDGGIYDLAREPHGRGIGARTEVFASIVDRYFEDTYGPDDPPDDLIHVTCTGYVSPSGAQKLVAQRAWETRVTHAYHMGCYAAVPALRIASGMIATGSRRVDIAHTELCSLHLDPTDHSLEQLVVQSLFADGLIRYSALPGGSGGLKVQALHERVLPGTSGAMTWRVDEHSMRMTLARDVPDRIGGVLRDFVTALYHRAALDLGRVRDSVFAVHPGGPKILDRVQELLELSPPADRGEPRGAPRAREHVVGDAAARVGGDPRRRSRAGRDADREPRVRPRADGVRRAAGEAVIALALVPVALQAVAMVADEGYFHRRRGLPRWERIGHPLDTLSIAICLVWLVAGGGVIGYVVLAIASTLFVTKDEAVHARACSAGEHWLHAVLFALHPVVLAAFTVLPRELVAGQLAVTIAFGLYQLVYWNVVRAPARTIDNVWYADLGERWYRATDTPIALLRAESRHRNPWIASVIGEAPLRVLDLGCGAGFLANDLAGRGHRVTGLDTTPENLEVARAHGRATYVVGDARRVPFPDASFDVVCAMDLLEHVDDPDAVIAEAARVLVPGGRLFFHTFNRTWRARAIVIWGVRWFVANALHDLHVVAHLFITARSAR